MQITLCEDDSMFHNGVPTLVVLMVQFDNGKSKRIPYPADRTISALYQDLDSIAEKIETSVTVNFNDLDKPVMLDKPASVVNIGVEYIPKLDIDKSSIIEKEDIVTVVKLEDREGATMELQIGQEVRILKVIATGVTLPGSDEITQISQGYDVVNDKSDRPERTRLFPHEVQLKRKRVPPPKKVVGKFEEILHCPLCDASNALVLEDSAFKGVCVGCQNDIVIERIIKHCKTDKCGNDVSCFDVGGSYEGICNKCKAKVVVPYA